MAIKGRKRSVKPQKKDKEIKLETDLCVLCSKVSDDNYLGKLLKTPTMIAHEHCLLFSPILKQLHDPDVERKGFIMGFKISDVEKEVKRIARLKCSVCRKSHAGVGCSNATCRKSFHVSCGLNGKAVGIFKDTFQFYCPDHASSQELRKQLSSCNKVVPECTICLDSFIEDDKADSNNQWSQFLTKLKFREVIHGLCCSRCWMHRMCIRTYGLSAGLHHIKCPQCGNKDTFIESVQQCGIWLPDRDASWELEPGAFQDLYEEPIEVVETTSDSCVATAAGDGDVHSLATSENGDTENIPTVTIDSVASVLDESQTSKSSIIEIIDCHVAVEPVVVTPLIMTTEHSLRQRTRPSKTPPGPAKRRRISKSMEKLRVIVQRQCARCKRTIVSLNCHQTSVLSETNRNQAVDEADTKIEYVCVSCHR